MKVPSPSKRLLPNVRDSSLLCRITTTCLSDREITSSVSSPRGQVLILTLRRRVSTLHLKCIPDKRALDSVASPMSNHPNKPKLTGILLHNVSIR